MTGKYIVNTLDAEIVHDKKTFLPMLRFKLHYGFIPEGSTSEEDLLLTKQKGCIASFGGGDELDFTPPLHLIAFRHQLLAELSPRLRRLVLESLSRSGAKDQLYKRVVDWRSINWNSRKGDKIPVEKLELTNGEVEE